MFLSMFLTAGLYTIALYQCAEAQDASCCNKFEYEYRVIQNLVRLDENQTMLLETINHQSEIIDKLAKDAKDAAIKVEVLYRAINQMKLAGLGGSATYTRWGRTTCPENGTELVYEGYAGGSYYTSPGGATDFLCLPREPLWGHYEDALQSGAYMYGVEYEFTFRKKKMDFFPGLSEDIYNHAVPCAVCRSTRASVLMVPARNACHDGWTLEYKGYLVSGYAGHAGASEYICLDDQPESVKGSIVNDNGKLLYFVEGRCGSLKCQPYVNGRELTCAVCTK